MSIRWIRSLRSSAVTVLLLGVLAVAADKPKLPPSGVVPDEPTAVKIAEAVFQPVFGIEEVAKWQPYRAQLDRNGVWTVYGTLPRGSRGGTPMLKIRKRDGTVLEVWHSM
jgi:NTF2 fold immunity protein